MSEDFVVTDREAFEREMGQNRAAYERMKDDLRRDYAGRYVAIAFGRLITASADFDEAVTAVTTLQPRPQHFLVFEGDSDPAFEIILDPYIELLCKP